MSNARRAVLIIAKEMFRDEELFDTQKALVAAGVDTVVASSAPGTRRGKLGGTAEAEMLVRDIDVDEFDAVVFVGGEGAMEYYDDPAALKIATNAAEYGKVLAAICIAPRILANARLLEGIQATCYESEAEAIEKLGAEFRDTDVVQDGKIITASGPHAATRFGETIARALGAS